jgi:hypothetical protein
MGRANKISRNVVLAAIPWFPYPSGSVFRAVSRLLLAIFQCSHSPLVDVDTLICTDCDANKRPPLSSESKHDETHPLVRYQYPEFDALLEVKSIESRLASLETGINERLDRLEKRIENHDLALDERFERLEQKIEKRLDAMEDLLRAFVVGK